MFEHQRPLQFNWSANAEPQLQEAASPQGLRSGCLQRLGTLDKE